MRGSDSSEGMFDGLPLAMILAEDSYHAVVVAITSSELRFGERSAKNTGYSLELGTSNEFGWRVVHVRYRYDRKQGRSHVTG